MSTVDEMFESMVECEVTLDDVIEKLAAVGVEVEPWQRGVVSRWLDLLDDGLPTRVRLSILTGWLSVST